MKVGVRQAKENGQGKLLLFTDIRKASSANIFPTGHSFALPSHHQFNPTGSTPSTNRCASSPPHSAPKNASWIYEKPFAYFSRLSHIQMSASHPPTHTLTHAQAKNLMYSPQSRLVKTLILSPPLQYNSTLVRELIQKA